MGFFTSAVYYRPGVPPVVSANVLAQFLVQLRQTEFVKNSDLLSAQINWGDLISEEVRPFDVEEDVSSLAPKPWWKRILNPRSGIEVATSISTIKSIDPDFSHDGDFDGLIERLSQTNETIGRLFLTSSLTDEQYKWFQSPHPSGEEINFRPDSWSLEFGEVNLGKLNGWDLPNGEVISEVQIGMMSFSLAGYGYFYPWTFNEWVEKFTQSPDFTEVCELCRKTWPVSPEPPSDELVMLRRECKGLWPYNDMNAPLDWAWGPGET